MQIVICLTGATLYLYEGVSCVNFPSMILKSETDEPGISSGLNDQLKSQFYSNISHQFRTPLTLIKGPLEQLSEEEDDPQKKMLLGVMHSNTSRLLELINQLLDLSGLENGNYRVRVFSGIDGHGSL